MIDRILISTLLCVAGFLIVRYPDWILNIVGYIEFAERVMMGGSRSFIKMVGVILILVGFLVLTNLHGRFIGGVLDLIY